MTIVRTSVAAIAMLAVALGVAGCASEPLAQQLQSSSGPAGKGYVSGDGAITEIPPKKRAGSVSFSSSLQDGTPVSSDDYAGRVLVVNFWYAGCPPCRAEAPDLQTSSQDFAAQDVSFLGVNVRDQAATARSFEHTYGVTYPSVLDVTDGALQLAFSGIVAPNAVPTTLVIDRRGRVAARVLGQLPDSSVLNALIARVLSEQRHSHSAFPAPTPRGHSSGLGR